MQSIYNKLEKVLLTKFPYKEERDEIIERSGEIVLLETAEEVLSRLGSDEKRKTFAGFINNGDVVAAINYAENEGVSVDEIFEKKSIEVTSLVFQM